MDKSQWSYVKFNLWLIYVIAERQTSATVRARPSSINLKDASSNNNEVTERKTFQNPRGKIVFKSRKQQAEEEARRNLLKAKIKCNYNSGDGIPPIYFCKKSKRNSINSVELLTRSQTSIDMLGRPLNSDYLKKNLS